MSQQASESVVVYADYVCPFCYLGYESLDQYQDQREQPIPTDWHPFDLQSRKRRPDGTLDQSVDDGKDDSYYEQAKQNVERLAEEYGVEMAEPLLKEVDSYDAQRVAYRIREKHPDKFQQFHRSVFDALWEDDRDISNQGVLEALAEDAEIPTEVVGDALNDEETAEELDAAFEAAQNQRITGVPTFVYGDHAARGAVPPEQLQRLVDGD
jgi:predicted DsbA family dithiol-disulfide isomerase